MTVEQEALRDWHRLFGLLLTDFFSGSPYIVDVERDLSVQQQYIDVVVVRRRRGRFMGSLPDGVRRTTPRCTCSALLRTWWVSRAAPTSAARSRPAGCLSSYLIRFEPRALPCRLRWKTSIGNTLKSTSRNSRRRSARKYYGHLLQR